MLSSKIVRLACLACVAAAGLSVSLFQPAKAGAAEIIIRRAPIVVARPRREGGPRGPGRSGGPGRSRGAVRPRLPAVVWVPVGSLKSVAWPAGVGDASACPVAGVGLPFWCRRRLLQSRPYRLQALQHGRQRDLEPLSRRLAIGLVPGVKRHHFGVLDRNQDGAAGVRLGGRVEEAPIEAATSAMGSFS